MYGEQVVKACIEGGAHHLDVSGEPEYLEKMQLMYNSKAKDNQVFVIGAAAYDSVPADMGLIYTRKQFGEGQLVTVESVLNVQHGPEGVTLNTGTMESAMYASTLSSNMELARVRKSLFPGPMPSPEYSLSRRWPFVHCPKVSKWLLPVPGTDEMVVNRTVREMLSQGTLDHPIEFFSYIGCHKLLTSLVLVLCGFLFATLANIGIGRWLLMKYPHIFTFGFFKIGGPTRKQIDGTSFTMEFLGHGFSQGSQRNKSKKPDKMIKTIVSGPELAYRTTPTCLIQCAVTLLKSRDKIPYKGGVLTTGSIFFNTDLTDRLTKHGVKFVMVQEY